MKLTRSLRIRSDNKNNSSISNNNDNDKFPTLQLFLLAICRVSEPIALTSCFPYAYAMVHDFHVGDRTSASFYTGIFISAFALAESLTGFFWGGLSDRIGRRPVLLTGCLGTLASLIFVGLASNFWMALAGRAIGGLLNGNVGIIQTMVGETVKRKEHEPRAYAVMPFVWSIGTIIGPAIGGMLAKPSESMPSIFPSSSIFARFPYLLPNLVCAVLLLLSAAFGYLLLAETHPDMQGPKHQASRDSDHFAAAAETPLITTGGAMADPGVDLRAETYGTFNTVDFMEEKQWLLDSEGRSRPSSVLLEGEDKVITYKIAMIVVALSIFTYHSMTFDQLLPIFLQDERIEPEPPVTPLSIPGGLGYSTQDVGVIMSINGAIALAIQGIIFPLVTAWLGIWKTFVTVTMLHPLAYLIVPFLAFLPTNTLTTGVYICLTLRNLTSILAYPVILIILKEAVTCPSNLGRVNGLAASAGAASRTLAPPLAGYLYGIGTSMGFTGLAWWGSALVAVVGAFQIFTLKRTRNKTAIVQPAAACLARALPERPKDVVRIVVHESDHV